MVLRARGHTISFPRRPLIMGIVNINDDSFCGDGTLDVTAAVAKARQMLNDGAEIIDIGAESARTNRPPITVHEEVARLLPFIDHWPKIIELHHALAPGRDTPLLSINTWRTAVVEQVLPLGGDLLNDLSGMPSARHAELCSQHGAALLIMHARGQPKTPQTHVTYPDIMAELERFFDEKITLAVSAGLPAGQILLDPGIDFAKQRADNLTIYRELDRLHQFHRPLLLPVSRKTVIGDVLALPDPLERDAGTLACIAAGMRRGAHIFRVHHVAAAAQSVKVLWNVQAEK